MAKAISTAKERFFLAMATAVPSMQLLVELSLEVAWELSYCDALKTHSKIATLSVPLFSDRQLTMMARARWVIWPRALKGQAEVIAEALDFAGISAADISYVETHGPGRSLAIPSK